METKKCIYPGCEKTSVGRGLCGSHYVAFRRCKDKDSFPVKPPLSRQINSNRKCSIEGCGRPHYGLDLCDVHYQRMRHNGTTDLIPSKKCNVEGCEDVHFSGGYCRIHSARFRRHGTTDAIHNGGGPKRHLLTDIDETTKRATCSICGSNSRIIRRYGFWRCKENAIKKTHKNAADRREWLNNYKIERGCFRCGYREHPAPLQFHHLDPSIKDMNISTAAAYPMSKVLKEIEKCVVVCANCHYIIHAENIDLIPI